MEKGRITEVHRTNYMVATNGREVTATVRGAFHEEGMFPVVGDYVELELLGDDKAVIDGVLPRTTVIKRKSAHLDEEQVIAANVDLMFIVMGLDGDFNVSRLERYLLLAAQSGVTPIVVLNKADVVLDIEPFLAEVRPVVGGVPLLVVSAVQGAGMGELLSYFSENTTVVLLGSSGAGKSTITNWLLGEERQVVKETRADDSEGRHTTTSRQLFALPHGGYLIDTPGMRELALVDSEDTAESAVFERIEHFARECKFRNCDHEKSTGCAVLAAVERGDITARELANYHKLIRERAFLEAKDLSAGEKHEVQNQKREQQRQTAIKRRRLSRGG